LFQFGERQNCIIFTKIETKLRQKLKYMNQIENEKMTHAIIVTRGIVTWYCHCHVARYQQATWQMFNF